MHVDPRRSSQQSLAAFVEAFAIDQRVLVIGDASDRLGSCLLDLGARGVELWDPEDARAVVAGRQAPRGLVVRPLPRDAADVRVNDFDLAVVTDLGLLEDVEQWVRWIRRWVGQLGVAVFAAPCGPPPEHFEYYELYDIIAGQFANVRMVGQMQFSGVAFAEFGVAEDSLAVTVDGQLADGGDAPEAFLAVASQRVVAIEPYLIVQMPPRAAPAQDDLHPASELPRQDPLRELRLALDETEAERAKLSHEIDARRAEAAKLTSELDDRGAAVERLTHDVQRLRAALEKAQVHARVESEHREREVARAEDTQRQLAAVRAELARATETQAAEVTRYEDALSNGAKSIRSLEAEVARRERMIQELVDGLQDDGRPTPTNVPLEPSAAPASVREDCTELRARLDALAVELAQREGEAQASAWSVAELERRLAECLASKG
jgi:hypothetical protein